MSLDGVYNPVLFVCVDVFLGKRYNERMKKETKQKKTTKIEVKITPEVRALFDGYHKETKQEMDKEMKKYIAELNKKSDEDIKRYIGSLTEEYQGRTSAVAEQFSGLNEKIEEIKGTLDEHGKILNEHGKILNEHGRMLKMHTEMIGTVMETAEEIKEELKNKADKNEVIHLSRRVSVLEHNV